MEDEVRQHPDAALGRILRSSQAGFADCRAVPDRGFDRDLPEVRQPALYGEFDE